MKGVQELVDSLHPLERKVLPILKDNIGLKDVERFSNLTEVEATRALQWLESKGVITTNKVPYEMVDLGPNGSLYVSQGLPEKRFLKSLPCSFAQLERKTGLNKDEVTISIGLLKRKGFIKLGKEVSMTQEGKDFLATETPEEYFLKLLPLSTINMNKEQKLIMNELLKRKDIIRRENRNSLTVNMTRLGKDLQKIKLKENMLDAVTPLVLKEGSWRNKEFRRYDVKTPVSRVYGGRRHFVNQAVDYARRVWLELGFKEMPGPILNTSFWNFDALFTPQDHPARELQDTFFIKNPAKGRLPDDKLVKAVRLAHENGSNSGSTGWRYSWNPDEAKKNVLRLIKRENFFYKMEKLKESDLPAKFFAIGRVFRNETLDWSHLAEFNQFEGIVVDPNANFRHLLGYLKNFITKIGFEKARFRPGGFPYTEPSVEIEAYDSYHNQWVELGGAGVFRPEVVIPLLGKDIPVLAWGPGLDRQMIKYYDIKDLRDLYRNDMQQLREMKVWLK